MKTLFIVVNVDWFFLSHRKEIALAAQNTGYDVTIITCNTGKKQDIEKLGLKVIDLPMDRTSTNLLKELKTFLFLFNLYRKKKPSVVHHVGLKVVLIGGLAARFAKVKGIVNAISGLGISFSQENINSLSTRLLILVLRFSHKIKNLKVIFQNNEDRAIFIENKIIRKNQAELTNGSGIDLTDFTYTPEPTTGKIKIIITARMIIEKGILVLIEAANLLKDEYEEKIQFILCGGLDVNPYALKKEELDSMCDGKYISWLGNRNDIKKQLMNSHIVAFPSYYKEGLPKSLIEACAIGRPIVTTNSVGCKDVVKDGINGFLVPIKDSKALAEKLKILINNKDLRKEMGKNSRSIAENNFSIDQVIDKHLQIYSQLANN